MSIDALIGAASTETERDLFAYDDVGSETVDQAWAIKDLASADWALSRLADCEAEAAAIDAQAEAAIAGIRARAEALKAKAAKGSNLFRFKLTEYAERERAHLLTGKRKSREMLHGKFSWRASPERLEVVDAKALDTWLRAQPIGSGLARWTVKPEMKALQDHFKTTGVIPDGCEAKAASESLTIEALAPERALEGK
jgi:phage host-nuclease inhibitor protein Gam